MDGGELAWVPRSRAPSDGEREVSKEWRAGTEQRSKERASPTRGGLFICWGCPCSTLIGDSIAIAPSIQSRRAVLGARPGVVDGPRQALKTTLRPCLGP